MDGTLIDSSPAVVVAWETMKATYTFLDLPHILASAHGYRTVDALRKWCLIEDPELLAREVVRFEEAILAAAKERSQGGEDGIVALPGVKDLLKQIGEGTESRSGSGAEGWAICTSCTYRTSPSLDGRILSGAGTARLSLFGPADVAPHPSSLPSATFFYASQAIPTAGLPTPKNFITAESVTKGKPAPDPYLLGAEKSGTTADKCMAFFPMRVRPSSDC
jgi:glycerol 3-phosphatase-1